MHQGPTMVFRQALLFLTLLAVAPVPGLGDWQGGLRVRFGVGTSGYFMSMPRSIAEAKTSRWTQVSRPEGPLESLVMYCPADYIFCVLFDDIEHMAGVQIAIPQEKFTESVFDWESRGFTSWTPEGSNTAYWTTQQYFVDEEILATSAEERVSAYDASKPLPYGKVWLTGNHKELLEVSAVEDDIANGGVFTVQACIPLMGRHYYYNMTAYTECTNEGIYPWFPLTASGDVVGMGFLIPGLLPESSLDTDYFERPDRSAIEMIVPDAPECLYEFGDTPGVITMHIYYIENPLLLTCILQ